MDREAIGFRTSAKEIQEAIAEQLAGLEAQGKSWEEIEKATDEVTDVLQKAMQELEADGDPDPNVVVVAVGFAQYIALSRLIARLGLEMTETHKRLAKVEKAVKDLKLAAKCSE